MDYLTLGRRRPRGSAAAGVAWAVGGLVAALAVLVGFYQIVDPAGAPWEHTLMLAIHGTNGRGLIPAAGAVSWFGYPIPIEPLALVLMLWWLVRRAPWKSGALLLNMVLLGVIDYGGKPLFHRLRPELWPHAVLKDFSYPSGHALFAFGFYGMIAALVLAGTGPAARAWGWTIWALFAVAICLSRLVLGVHWPTDVVAGAAAGAIVLLAELAALRRWGARV